PAEVDLGAGAGGHGDAAQGAALVPQRVGVVGAGADGLADQHLGGGGREVEPRLQGQRAGDAQRRRIRHLGELVDTVEGQRRAGGGDGGRQGGGQHLRGGVQCDVGVDDVHRLVAGGPGGVGGHGRIIDVVGRGGEGGVVGAGGRGQDETAGAAD